MALALKALARRELTEAEVAARLEARGAEAQSVATVIERLKEAGGIDDERYARLFTEDKRGLEGWGEERIRAALESRGVAGGIVDSALGSHGRDEELDRAVELLERRGEELESEAARGRAFGFLVRRGYASEVAYDAVRAVESGAGRLR